MAFNKNNMNIMVNSAQAGVPRVYCYYNAGGDTITADGYFSPDVGIKNNDLVLVLAQNSATAPLWYKLAVADNVVVASVLAA